MYSYSSSLKELCFYINKQEAEKIKSGDVLESDLVEINLEKIIGKVCISNSSNGKNDEIKVIESRQQVFNIRISEKSSNKLFTTGYYANYPDIHTKITGISLDGTISPGFYIVITNFNKQT